jgi:hypothetical protein
MAKRNKQYEHIKYNSVLEYVISVAMVGLLVHSIIKGTPTKRPKTKHSNY